MRDIITFLTSKEIIVVYIVAAIACFLAFIIYLVDKNYAKRKQKHNTKELNKLVEDVNLVIKEEEKSKEKEESTPTPSATPATMPSVIEATNPVELLDMPTLESPTTNVVLESLNNLEAKEEPVIVKEEIINPPITEAPKKEEELEYTTIEPNVEQAKEELRKLAIELEKEEQLEQQEEPTIISNYEEEQETNAIISLEELVKKSKEMYAANELSQYKDEGNEPISLTDLEQAKKTNSAPIYDEPFIISNVVLDMEEELNKENAKQLQMNFENPPVTEKEITQAPVIETSPNIDNAKKDLYQTAKFKKSPVISPIYGIERSEDDYLQLENTANYDKLDEEIRKTNEFLMTLKELQKNLD